MRDQQIRHQHSYLSHFSESISTVHADKSEQCLYWTQKSSFQCLRTCVIHRGNQLHETRFMLTLSWWSTCNCTVFQSSTHHETQTMFPYSGHRDVKTEQMSAGHITPPTLNFWHSEIKLLKNITYTSESFSVSAG